MDSSNADCDAFANAAMDGHRIYFRAWPVVCPATRRGASIYIQLLFLFWFLRVGSGARVDNCCNTERCHPNCAAVAAAARSSLPVAPDRNVKSMSLLQSTMFHNKKITKIEGEERNGEKQQKKENDEEIEEQEKEDKLEEEEPMVSEDKVQKAERVVTAPTEMAAKMQQQKLEDGSRKAKESNASLSNQSTDSGGTASGAGVADAIGVISPGSSLVKHLLPHQTPRGTPHFNITPSSGSPSWMQPVRGRSLFEAAALKLNHSAGNHSGKQTSRGLQPGSQLQGLSHGSASDANHATAFVPFSANGSSMRLSQLSVSLHSLVTLAHRKVGAASVRFGNISFCVLSAILVLVAVLVYVCFSSFKMRQNARVRQNNRAPMQESRQYQTKPLGTTGHLSSGIQSSSLDLCSKAVATPLQPWVPLSRAQDKQESPQAPASTAATPATTVSRGEADCFLCKLLVVPPGCESILHVPLNPMNSFQVHDQYGNPVIGVELKAGKNVSQELRRVEVFTREGVLVAQCVRQYNDPGSRDQFQLIRSTGEYFATLAPGDPGELQTVQSCPAGPRTAWTVRTSSGSEWSLRGYFDSYSVEITDTLGRVLAMAQPKEHDAGLTYLLRIAPLMDVSIALCSLVAIYHLR